MNKQEFEELMKLLREMNEHLENIDYRLAYYYLMT
jgi:hypothetical protein